MEVLGNILSVNNLWWKTTSRNSSQIFLNLSFEIIYRSFLENLRLTFSSLFVQFCYIDSPNRVPKLLCVPRSFREAVVEIQKQQIFL